MNRKTSSTITIVAFILTAAWVVSPTPASGQTALDSKATASWTPPRTPDGQPDIQGNYARRGIWARIARSLNRTGRTARKTR